MEEPPGAFRQTPRETTHQQALFMPEITIFRQSSDTIAAKDDFMKNSLPSYSRSPVQTPGK
jgi:hypothetical protein